MQKTTLRIISLFIIFVLFNSCKKNSETVSPSQVKTVLSDKTLILNETTQSSILEVKDNAIVFKTLPTLPNGRASLETIIGAGNNVIIQPNSKYPDGVARYIQEITKNTDGTFTAKTTYPKINQVFKSLNEKVTAPVNATTISKIYKPNGEILPYSVSAGVKVPVKYSFEVKSEPGLNAPSVKLGDITIEGSVEFSGQMEYACIMDETTNFWASRAEFQDKEKLTASFATNLGLKKKKMTINKYKIIKFDNVDFAKKPFKITVPIFETKLSPVLLGVGIWITPRIQFYAEVVGDVEGQISVTILERDGGTTVRYDEYTDIGGWKTEIQKIGAVGDTKTLTNLELGLAGSLSLTPTLELSGSLWGLSNISSVGVTLGLESKLEMGVALSPKVGNTSFDFTLTGKEALKLGAKIKLNALWTKIIDYEPNVKTELEWDIFKPIQWNLLAEDSDPTSTLPTDGLIAYYPFNGNANDESGNKNNGIVNKAVLTVDRFGNTNRAYNFNGNAFIDVNTISNSTLTSNFTLSTWVSFLNFSNNYPCMIFGENQFVMLQGWGPVYGANQKKVSFYYEPRTAPNNLTANSISPLTENKFYNVVARKSGSSFSIFVNGVLQQTLTNPNNLANGKFLRFGGGRDSNEALNGVLDDIRIYNRALSDTEILALSKE